MDMPRSLVWNINLWCSPDPEAPLGCCRADINRGTRPQVDTGNVLSRVSPFRSKSKVDLTLDATRLRNGGVESTILPFRARCSPINMVHRFLHRPTIRSHDHSHITSTAEGRR